MEKSKRIYLIRHGQVLGHETFPIFGHTDVELTSEGITQMKQAAERLRLVELEGIYSSDLKRASLGARCIAAHHTVPIHFLQELREMHFGNWEGMTLSEIRTGFPEELERRQEDIVHYRAPGNGESVAALSDRVMEAFENILSMHDNGNIAIVAHGAVNRVILSHALGLDLSRMFHIQQDYGCLNIIEYFQDNTLVRLMNG
jgi:alpha-ribazole phosphatase/probable phosphoglycerate mutase